MEEEIDAVAAAEAVDAEVVGAEAVDAEVVGDEAVDADVVVVETVQHEIVITRNMVPIPIKLPHIVYHVNSFANLRDNTRRLSPAAMAGKCSSCFSHKCSYELVRQ